MFNGIIKSTGTIKNIKKGKKSMMLSIYSNLKLKKNSLGDSISCDGVCLTLTSKKNKMLTFYLSDETIKRSNFSQIKIGKIVNMEKSLKYGEIVSGHYTQGHVDTVGKILNIKIVDKTWIIQIKTPKQFNKYIVEKASIHINGVSLTVSKKKSKFFEINIIPHTLKLTNLKNLKENDLVNIEFDYLTRFIISKNEKN